MNDAILRRNEDDTPVAQSLRIGFWVLRLAMIALALFWLTSNVRTVPPDSQAVSIRFGAVVGTRDSGLVLAWPRPFEDVVLVPSAQRQLELRIDAGQVSTAATVDPASRFATELPPETAAIDLTGDGGALLLDSTVFYRVTDPAAFYLAQAHVAPALRRLYLAAAAAIIAGSDLNDVIVVQSNAFADGTPALQARREALRGALVAETNRRLLALAAAHASLGIEASRVDVSAYLPPAAKNAFDSVLEAAQLAEQGLAAAHTDAARADQGARQEHDRLIAEANANANERLSVARTQAATIGATVGTIAADPAMRPALVEQLYRERVSAILHAAGSVSTVDPRSGRVILPGGAVQ